ncbi:MAG: murein biosynthesis integral membrane protein MurJ [Anaerolineae bacterium]
MFKNSKLIQASVLVITLSALNKVSGFAKLFLASSAFGTSADADAMTAAWQLPDVFFVMVSGGAMATALIPVYSAALIHRDRAYQQKLSNTILTTIAVILGFLCLTAGIFAPWLARVVIVPDFDPVQQMLTANLMRIALGGMFIFGLSSILVSLLHSYQHFLAPALGALLFDLGFVIGMLVGAEEYGVYAMVWGGVLGICMHFVCQLFMVRRYGISFWPELDFALPEFRQVLYLLWPRLITLVALESVDIVIIRLASGLPEGSASAWLFATVLVNMPVDLFGISLVITFFPTLSEEFNSGGIDKLHRSLETGLRYLWFFIVPSFVGLVALGPAGIAVIMERGEFTADSTQLVYSLLVIAASGAIAISTYEVLALLYFSRHDTVRPMVIQLISVVVGVALNYLLVGPLGIYGLAFGRLAYALTIMLLAWQVYRWMYQPLGEKGLFIAFGRCALAAGGMAVAIRLVATLNLDRLLFVILAIPVGVVVYGVIHYLLGGTAMVEVWQGFMNRELQGES